MNNINVWNIDFNIDNQKIIDNFLKFKQDLALLNLSKPINEYSLVEQIVYNIALFHCNRLNISLDNSTFVEFWFKSVPDTDNFHLDCDEFVRHKQDKYIHPLLSCVTYLNDHNCPTILTNIDYDTYKYKEFEDQTSIFCSFPRFGKHITFEPNKFHGTSNVFNNDNSKMPRYMLAMNLWDKKPENICYCDNNIINNELINNVNTELINNEKEYINSYKIIKNISIIDNPFNSIFVSNKIINFDLFEKLLYNKETNLFLKFGEFIPENNNNHCFQIMINNESEKTKLQTALKNKYGNIIDDINTMMDENAVICYNRFLQRFHYSKIFTNDTCKWIINECEQYATINGGWTKNRHNKYPTTDLPIENIKTIFNFIIESFKTISLKITKSYNLNDDIKINFVDVFVVKYKFNEQNHLELHKDGSFLSFNILLSNPDDFEGGGTYFDDGLIMRPEQGDLIIHSSKMKHSGLPITKGTRYLLVGFINLDMPLKNVD
jgi:hypothetical protein